MTDAQLPTLQANPESEIALVAGLLPQLTSEQLTAFLLQRRWFGGKGRAPAGVRIGDVIDLRGATRRTGMVFAAVARLDVDDGSGRATSYQLPLMVSIEEHVRPSAIVARIEDALEHRSLIDALDSDLFRAALGGGFERPTMFTSRSEPGSGRWIIELVNGGGGLVEGLSELPSRVIDAEQSNTSIIFGDVAIFKLFRRLEPGLNPDVEIGHFLTTKTRFTHTPRLLGVVRYEGGDGLHSIAGMLQEFLPGSTDAWRHALEQSREYFRSEGAPHPYAGDAERLGRITRELHDALASADGDAEFAPRRATAADVTRWVANARRRIEEALSLLGEKLEGGKLPDAAGARALMGDRDAFLSRLDELSALIGDDAGQLIRHHGDYHLGQVLRTREGDFQIIDFEGEPARPLAERRERNSALRDVAGMLRSFAYAASTLAAEQREKGGDAAAATRRAAAWEQGAREAFLRGYLGDTRAEFLPTTARRIDALRELFETEKVFYELSYELNNRPDWVWIPIAGAGALRATPAGRS